MVVTTDSSGHEGKDRAGPVAWALALALDCEHPFLAPARVSLEGLDLVEIGRGPARTIRAEGARLRIDLDDRRASGAHVRLVRSGDGWRVEDAGSKNGTFLNGRRVNHAALADGHVLEVGGTFLVARRGLGRIADLAAATGIAPGLLTVSPLLERELAALPKLARSRVPVVIRGESGTGKELVARAIHELSGRTGAFVPVNCAALPRDHLEEELFGSARAPFPGAEPPRGIVRSAAGGTLLLDDVGELPAAAQASLLRVLEDGEVLPLGAGVPVKVDVRVVATAGRAIDELVTDERFRSDLHARLLGYEVCLPPLRARIEDLGLLVAASFAREERPQARLSRTAARALFLHGWPLNVRELERLLAAAVVVADGPELGVKDLPLAPAANQPEQQRDRLVALLDKHAGNLSAVSRELGTSRSQLLRLFARHGLAPDGFKRR